jgi:hypothetical protein
MKLDNLAYHVKVIKPIAVAAAMLTAISVAEPDTGEAVWNSANAYSSGQTGIISTTTHRKYTALQAMTAGAGAKDPTVAANVGVYWKDAGPDNRWAMFDNTTNVGTVAAATLTWTIVPGKRVTSIAFTGLKGSTLVVNQIRGGVTIKTWTFNLVYRNVYNFTTFFFDSFNQRNAVVLYDAIPYSDATFTFSLTASDGASQVQVGNFVMGTYEVLGSCEAQTKIDGTNYSTIARDFTSQINTLTQRRTVPKISAKILFEKARTSRVFNLKDTLNAVPSHYAMIDNSSHDYYEPTQMVGVYKTFTLDLSDPEYPYLMLDTEAI